MKGINTADYKGSVYILKMISRCEAQLNWREMVDLCVTICDGYKFASFIDIITNDSIDMSTKNAVQIQLATVALEISLTAFWRAVGIEPAMVTGHSLGEYAALYAAGVLSLVDTLYLVGHERKPTSGQP